MIERSTHENIRLLRMAHGKANALDLEFLHGLTAAIKEEQQGPERALILTGTGKIFSAGVDLNRVLEGRTYLRDFLPALDALIEALIGFDKPLIAAINGHAIAGGLVIACCADHRICVENNATLGVPEVVVGVPFPISALEVMRASVPPQHLRRITLQGPILPPERALAQGLVDSLVDADTLEDRALSAARSLAALPTASFAMSKTDLWRPFLDRMRAADKQRMIDAWCSEAVQGAIRRYVEKTLRR